jgi:hypothetical protein
MLPTESDHLATSPDTSRDRSRLLAIAALTTTLAGLHLADHVLRGANVRSFGLDPHWDHSGWPFTSSFTPFSASLIAVTVILLGGIALTIRGKLWAGYWLVAAVLLLALVVQVHLVPGAHQESPSVIYRSWVGHPLVGGLAVTNTVAILGCLVVMAVNAYRIGRRSGRWR